MDVLFKLINMLDGWKRLLSYAALNVPFLNSHPMLLGAIQDVLADPHNEQKWAYAISQALLAWGMLAGLIKNLGLGPSSK